MHEFATNRTASKDEQVRAWCVEQAIDHLREVDVPHQSVIILSKMIEDYVTSGDVTGVIQSAIEEGYSEGRWQAWEALAGMVDVRILERAWRANNWKPNKEGLG